RGATQAVGGEDLGADERLAPGLAGLGLLLGLPASGLGHLAVEGVSGGAGLNQAVQGSDAGVDGAGFLLQRDVGRVLGVEAIGLGDGDGRVAGLVTLGAEPLQDISGGYESPPQALGNFTNGMRIEL